MPAPEGERFLYPSNRMTDAFRAMDEKHLKIGETLDELLQASPKEIARAGGDYFNTGVSYFANRGHDTYMQEVGTVAWWTLDQRNAIIELTNNLLDSAIDHGVPANFALKRLARRDEPYVLVTKEPMGFQKVETAYVLLPFSFVIKAKRKPIEALAMVAASSSRLRDFANFMPRIDPRNIEARQAATQAHFLHEAVKQNPGIESQLNETMRERIRLYPQGINSLEPSQRYRGTKPELQLGKYN